MKFNKFLKIPLFKNSKITKFTKYVLNELIDQEIQEINMFQKGKFSLDLIALLVHVFCNPFEHDDFGNPAPPHPKCHRMLFEDS